RERRDVVLELAQLEDDVGRNDVGAGREQLPELDEGRAELVEHLPQVLAALRALALDWENLRAPGQQVGQAVALEEVPEPVLDRDLGDLRDPSQVPRRGALRARRHALSVARRCREFLPAAIYGAGVGPAAPSIRLSARRRRCSSWATRSSSSS